MKFILITACLCFLAGCADPAVRKYRVDSSPSLRQIRQMPEYNRRTIRDVNSVGQNPNRGGANFGENVNTLPSPIKTSISNQYENSVAQDRSSVSGYSNNKSEKRTVPQSLSQIQTYHQPPSRRSDSVQQSLPNLADANIKGPPQNSPFVNINSENGIEDTGNKRVSSGKVMFADGNLSGRPINSGGSIQAEASKGAGTVVRGGVIDHGFSSTNNFNADRSQPPSASKDATKYDNTPPNYSTLAKVPTQASKPSNGASVTKGEKYFLELREVDLDDINGVVDLFGLKSGDYESKHFQANNRDYYVLTIGGFNSQVEIDKALARAITAGYYEARIVKK